MKCTHLKETGKKQNRWLSIPDSRIVINPFCYNLPGRAYPSQYSNRPYIPLNIGYLPPKAPASGIGVNHPDLLMFHEEASANSKYIDGINLDLSDGSLWTKSEHETAGDCEAFFDLSGISVTVKEGAQNYWQYITAILEVDLDSTPILEIEVSECCSAWGVKVSPEQAESNDEDIVLIVENSASGVFYADISKVTGWRGTKRFKLRLYAYGFGKTVKYSKVKIAGVENPIHEAAHYETAWMPHELPFNAEYQGKTVLEGYDTFWDCNTVVRAVNIINGEGIIIGGRYKGKLLYKEDENILSVADDMYSYSVSFSGLEIEEIRYYSTFCEYLSGSNGTTEPGKMGYWRIKASESESRFCTVVNFGQAGECNKIGFEEINEKRLQNEEFWNNYLYNVPKIDRVLLEKIDPKGITPEMIERQYYAAWVFLNSNILPRSYETGYGFIQMACGKPSLWAQGAPEAPYTASWESLVAMQLYTAIDPEKSWEAFKGLMSLVDEEGILGGESLPSKKAQTAFLLYNATQDKEALKEVYPAIKKYMLWRVENPRWILGEINDPNDRDADFVISALVDILYLVDISEILNMREEADIWKSVYKKLMENYTGWFWEKPEDIPYQHYDISSGIRKTGHTSWVFSGMYLPDLGKNYETSLLNAFVKEFDTDQPFGGLSMPKYPEITFDIWGLLNKGYHELAEKLMEVCIRDITLANFFSEQYDEIEFPYPTGVRPSIFGCALLIECVLMRCGRMPDSMRQSIKEKIQGDIYNGSFTFK